MHSLNPCNSQLWCRMLNQKIKRAQGKKQKIAAVQKAKQQPLTKAVVVKSKPTPAPESETSSSSTEEEQDETAESSSSEGGESSSNSSSESSDTESENEPVDRKSTRLNSSH